MNVLVTDATGIIGRQAVPRLLQAGHDVAGVARSDAGADWLRAVGATPVKVDLFDPAMVRAAVANANAVVHLATAIPPLARMRRPGAWRPSERLLPPLPHWGRPTSARKASPTDSGGINADGSR